MSKNKNISRLAECAIMVALASVLSLIKIPQFFFPNLGGSITLFSMLPICVIAIKYGLGWGFGTAFVYSAMQLLFGITLDGVLGWGLSAAFLVGTIFFDYLIPFTMLGVSGVFRKKGVPGIITGIVIALVIRWLCHIVSGVIFFASWSPWENPLVYSIAYNSVYMVPELILTTVGAVLLYRVKALHKIIAPVK